MEKVVPPARVTLPAEGRQLVHPSCLAPPRQLVVIHINGCLNLTTTQGKVNSPRVIRGRVISVTRDHVNGELDLIKVLSITIHDSTTRPNRKSIMTTKVFSFLYKSIHHFDFISLPGLLREDPKH